MDVKSINNGEFPPERKYVLIYSGERPWSDSDDQVNVFWNVAKMIKGISKEERDILRMSNSIADNSRANCYKFGDEFENNKVPYAFKEFGQMKWFGQEINYWCELPVIIDKER